MVAHAKAKKEYVDRLAAQTAAADSTQKVNQN
jgi:hypothetical protein